jgi:small-conductance mechanosensitive channel
MEIMTFLFHGPLAELWEDLQHPALMWQLAALFGCIVAAKLVERLVRGRQADLEPSLAVKLGRSGLRRLCFPLTALVLVLFAREALRPVGPVNLLSIAIPLLASMAVIRFVFFVLRVTFNHTTWLHSFERSFSTLVWCVVALHITGWLPELVQLLEGVKFALGKQKLDLWLLLQGLLVVAIAILVSLWLGSLIEARLMRAEGMDNNLQVVFSRLTKACLLVLAVMISLPSVGIDLTALSVFGGALGVGLGFGLQKIASNYVSGFIILLDRSIRIGNVIAVGADKGKVTQITTRYTVLRAGNGVESLIPNEALIANTVQNETYSDFRVRHALPVQIGYQDDPEQAIALLQQLAAAHPHVSSETPPQAFLMLFADSGINLELLFWIDSQEVNAQQVRSELNLAILRGFTEAGISIPFPQREIRLLGTVERPGEVLAGDAPST